MTKPMTEFDRTAARKGVFTVSYYVIVAIVVVLAGTYLPSGMCGPGLDVACIVVACVTSLVLWVRSAVLRIAKGKVYQYALLVHTLVCGGFLLFITISIAALYQ